MIRSPLFYVGDKYKIIKQITVHFPTKINRYFEPFVGGDSSFLNVYANEYYLNDINSKLISLHCFLFSNAKKSYKLFSALENIILKFGLSYSYKENLIPNNLKTLYPKNYFAKFNNNAYKNMKDIYNSEKKDDLHYLYLLLIYGFNRMLRFNRNDDFNIPVGNLDFNKNVKKSLEEYFAFVNNKNINFNNCDWSIFLNNINFKEFDFIYLDPPYLISSSEYNRLLAKLWLLSYFLNLKNLF